MRMLLSLQVRIDLTLAILHSTLWNVCLARSLQISMQHTAPSKNSLVTETEWRALFSLNDASSTKKNSPSLAEIMTSGSITHDWKRTPSAILQACLIQQECAKSTSGPWHKCRPVRTSGIGGDTSSSGSTTRFSKSSRQR